MGKATYESYYGDYLKNRYRRRMDSFIEHLGGKCVRCESTRSLQIDHVDPETKSFDLSQKWGTNLDLLMEELKKCQLLCKVCHKNKTDNEDAPLMQVGVKNSNSRLTQVQVDEIRSRYVPGKYGYKRLAKDYGVSHMTIRNIVQYITHTHIQEG